MPLLPVENEFLSKQTVVGAALSGFLREGAVSQSARMSGEVGIGASPLTPSPLVPIDPVTGAPIAAPIAGAGPFSAGDVCGGKEVNG